MTEEKRQQEFVKMEAFARRMKVFLENQQRFPAEALLPYMGQYIAWAPDGASIIAHTDDPNMLEQLILAAGFDPAECVRDHLHGLSSI